MLASSPSQGLLSPTSSGAVPYHDTSLQSQSTSTTAPLPASHPISLKLRSILTAKYDESATRQALETLAELYATAQPASEPPGPALRAIPAARFQADSSVDTNRARTRVRGDIDARLNRASADFIGILKTVDEGLGDLHSHVANMHDCCDQVQAKLSTAGESTRYLLEHAQGLQTKRTLMKMQHTIATLFLEHFTLSPSEIESIHSREVPVDTRLFAAMDRLHVIRSECRALLEGSDAGGGGGMRAGMDVMDSTAALLEAGFQKMSKWCSFEFRQPAREGLEVSPQMREAVRRLSAREDLLEPVLATLSATRFTALMNAFINALTVGGPAPLFLPRPIELHAHDPIRYVGDMLAWVHQTLASEREFLTGLFGEKEGEGGRRIGQRRRGLEGSIDLKGMSANGPPLGRGELRLRVLLDKIMEGCCRPLKVRVQQTVRSQEGCITTYRLANLVQFYRITMERTIGTRAALSKTLKEITELSYEAFFVTLDRQAGGLLRFVQLPAADLSPPAPLIGASATLKELLAVHESSLADDESGPSSSPDAQVSQPTTTIVEEQKASTLSAEGLDDFSQVFSRLVDPMLEMCRRMANLLVEKRGRGKRADQAEWERDIFHVNCLVQVLNVLSPHTFAEDRAQRVRHDIDEAAQRLIQGHYAYLLTESGLAPIIGALDTKDINDPLSHHPAATPAIMQTQLGLLSDFLSSPLLISSPRLAQLSSPSMRAAVQHGALQHLTEAYGRIVEAVQAPANKYEWRHTLVRRSKEEVGLLLGVADAQQHIDSDQAADVDQSLVHNA